MVDSSIDTLFLLIKGEIQALPVKARMKDMLLNSVGLINENFRNGDWAAALDGIALILEKKKRLALQKIYTVCSSGV